VFLFGVHLESQKVPHDPARYPWHWRRAQLVAELQKTPGNHLIIVHYPEGYSRVHEWVYNRADIDRAKVVWAQDMGPQNEELIHYFSNRQVWMLQASPEPASLIPYAGNHSAK
jgi:hypothetical protein